MDNQEANGSGVIANWWPLLLHIFLSPIFLPSISSCV